MTNIELRSAFERYAEHQKAIEAVKLVAEENGLTLTETVDRLEAAGTHSRGFGQAKRIVRYKSSTGQDPAPADKARKQAYLDGFTPMYQRIIELNEQKARIEEELQNIKATLRNAMEIAESGEVPK